MDINKVIDDIQHFEASEKKWYTFISISFIQSTLKSENRIYRMDANKKTKKLILGNILHGLEKNFKNKEQRPFSLKYTNKNCLTSFNPDKFPSTKDLLKSIQSQKNSLRNITDDQLKKVDLYSVTITIPKQSNDDDSEEMKYTFVSRFENFYALQKKLFVGQISGNNISISQKDSLIGFNPKIEMVFENANEIIINNSEAKFDSLLKMDSIIKVESKKKFNDNENFKRIFSDDSMSSISEKISKSKRYSSWILRIADDEERLQKTIDNIYKIQDILTDPNNEFNKLICDIELQSFSDNANPEKSETSYKIVLKEGGNPDHLLNAISDAFYLALISGVSRTDDARL
ncbi:hypothetical protein [Rothia nasimurium]|uniref:hypothetical protein n=1 Tax=Rothia nasimurium TaxID=85336 RepID=UPI001F1CD5E7|nr:hypothetical protein [Rothia nasimurium]